MTPNQREPSRIADQQQRMRRVLYCNYRQVSGATQDKRGGGKLQHLIKRLSRQQVNKDAPGQERTVTNSLQVGKQTQLPEGSEGTNPESTKRQHTRWKAVVHSSISKTHSKKKWFLGSF